MKKIFIYFSLAIFTLFSVVSCQEEATEIAVKSITLSQTSMELTIEDQAPLDAVIEPENATDKKLTWTSSKESVATVSADGIVEAKSAGVTYITVSSQNGVSARCEVTVDVAINAVTGEASHISCRNAMLSGKIVLPNNLQGEYVTGILYSTSVDVFIGSATRVVSESLDDNNAFTISTEALEPETQYYYRGYLSHSGEVYYGEIKSFKTLAVGSMIQTKEASDINPKDAVFHATLDMTDCNYGSIEYGFILSREGESSRIIKATNLSDKKFSAKVEDLINATSYSYCAYVILDGKTYNANEVTLKTEELKVTVSLNDVVDITEFEATVSGGLTIEYEGILSKSAKLYYSSAATDVSDLKSNGIAKTLSLASDGTFSVQLTELRHSTKYYYIVVAWVDYIEFVSEVLSFDTVIRIVAEGAIDLGLSVCWASCNLGASAPEEYGLYYQWGDTVGYGSDTSDGKYFNWKDDSGNVTYKWCNGSYNTLTKYNTRSRCGIVDNKTVLEMEDDAARVALGGKWRMPTDAEWAELRNPSNCLWTWTTINGVYGYKVQSKKSGYTDNWVFLPAAGCRGAGDLYDVGSNGEYWSSSLFTGYPDDAYCVRFRSGDIYRDSCYRYFGQSVRPVSE